MTETSRELARRLADGPTLGIGLTKRLLNASEDASLGDSLAAEAAMAMTEASQGSMP